MAMLLACEQPAPLPPSAVDMRPPPFGRLVQSGPVRGFLARPGESSAAAPAELRLVDALGPATREAAFETAATGHVVLAIAGDIDPERAHAYLDGMPSTGAVTQTCLRAVCP